MDNQEIEIDIDVSGSMCQIINLKQEFAMSQDEFVKKFKEGKIVTSLGGIGGRVYLIDNTFTEIGKVISQSSNDDMEISLSVQIGS